MYTYTLLYNQIIIHLCREYYKLNNNKNIWQTKNCNNYYFRKIILDDDYNR